ncbi:Uncharacterised protein [Pseudomonas putida]|nr:Uncharacterised protein [Pseudomonas putida]
MLPANHGWYTKHCPGSHRGVFCKTAVPTKALMVSDALADPGSADVVAYSNHDPRTIDPGYVPGLPVDQLPTQDFPVHRIEADHDVADKNIVRFRFGNLSFSEQQISRVSTALPGKRAVSCWQNHD